MLGIDSLANHEHNVNVICLTLERLLSDFPLQTVPVLLPLAVETAYDYRPPQGLEAAPGDFVEVPLGATKRIGVVWDPNARSAQKDAPLDPKKLKAIIAPLEVPPLPEVSRRFIDWVAHYTLAQPGMVLRMAMSAPEAFQPATTRQGVTLSGQLPERMTKARQKVLDALQGKSGPLVLAKSELAVRAGVSPGVIDGLLKSGVLTMADLPPERFPEPNPNHTVTELRGQQIAAAQTLREAVRAQRYQALLLDGVTGSGKTEVYFEAVAEALRQGRQALILLPEIALTGQFLARFFMRFGAAPAEWHSAMTPSRRAKIWRGVATGEVKVVIGARSALFLPFKNLGVIIVDEEHEPAYKQEDRVIYQGRDMAVVRAHLGGIPVVLSSATPSVESFVNAQSGRYTHVPLTERFSGAELPALEAIDMREAPPERGHWLSPVLVKEIAETLAAGQQSLLFLNRRGYAPLTLCRKCGHRYECPQCTAWLVEHRYKQKMQCHHCGFETPVPQKCISCEAENALTACGPGVERVAEEVKTLFPKARLAILSSDLLPSLKEQRTLLAKIAAGEVDIIVGTQLVAKGHHFPGLALVGVVDGDLGLSQSDPRAGERCWQLLHQVTGRAGRADIKGRGFLQTYMPEHPVMQTMIEGDRDKFLQLEIAIRKRAGLPPFGRLAALIISSKHPGEAAADAANARRLAPFAERVTVLGPTEAPIFKIRGRHRFRLLVKAAKEIDLQAYMRTWLQALPAPRGSLRRVCDIDPYNFM